MIVGRDGIRQRQLVHPLVERARFNGMSYGLGPAGYDVRLDQDVRLEPGEFKLASTLEEFRMTTDVLGIVHDKSTLIRRGLSVFNTVIEPGWCGFLTLELKNNGNELIELPAGSPIAQIIFHMLDCPTDQPYSGKYQDQARGPQEARFEQ